MSATVRRDDVTNRVSGNRHPLTVHPDFIMVANLRLWVGRQSVWLQHGPWPSFLLSVA